MSEIRWLPLESNPEARQIYSRSLAAVSLKHDDKDCSVQTCNADGTGQATADSVYTNLLNPVRVFGISFECHSILAILQR